MRERRAIEVEGIVQGVGFRPFVHSLANRHRLAGFVRNDSAGVSIEVEGDPSGLDGFVEDLRRRAPPLARIERLRVDRREPRGSPGFHIESSRRGESASLFAPADTATCDDCLRELFDPADRRYRYPFLNCTNCGPRLTIIRELPYDRPGTTMAGFEMCEACRREYEDPADRRFHAQPVACPECGPRLVLRDADGRVLEADDPLAGAVEALLDGGIVAIKGLGGYHLACDATGDAAVKEVRRRKRRPDKPLAVMVPDLETARRLCRVGPEEAQALTDPARPIVLLRRRWPERQGASAGEEGSPGEPSPGPGAAPPRLPAASPRPRAASPRPGGSSLRSEDTPATTRISLQVAPGIDLLGVMLPYTPLHHLLLEAAGRPLVMTSGNVSDEPIVYRDEGAVAELGEIADLLLGHDRPIETRCDDSVVRAMAGEVVPLRRSRGMAPQPVQLPEAAPTPLLALGGHLKTTICLVRERHTFPSHHLGDLDSPAARQGLRHAVSHYRRLLDLEPRVVAHDLHPDYATTRLARQLAEAEGLELEAVQHHHAHVAACAAENGVADPVIGVALDGTGYGEDETVWGGEILVADLGGYRRVVRLRQVPLPGGEAAVREPWRMAAAHLRDAGEPLDGHVCFDGIDGQRLRLLEQMLERGVNSPPTSSAGRLFDAVAALVGLRVRSTFEGQAAMELEAVLDPDVGGAYPLELRRAETGAELLELDTRPLIDAAAADVRRGTGKGAVSARFHRGLAEALAATCEVVRERTGLDTVALSGGVFQNAWLLERLVGLLGERGFTALRHRRVPCNDGGLAYGQAAVAVARRAATRLSRHHDGPVAALVRMGDGRTGSRTKDGR